jgi:L-asparaginase II
MAASVRKGIRKRFASLRVMLPLSWAHVEPHRMTELRIEATREDLVESVHRVSLAVMSSEGRLIASAGDPSRVAFWRSSAKPFQAMPLVDDGAADALGITRAELALACASHSSEPRHLEVAAGLLRRAGAGEDALACGPHPPISPAVAERVTRDGIPLTPIWSNCSGKHAGMLALARHHSWPLAGYERPDHPVQARMRKEVGQWTRIRPEAIPTATDGCAVVTFGLPLSAMALAWARLGADPADGPRRIREAMTMHPDLIAGTGRLCTELMTALPGRVLAKVGAAGIYCAALPELGLGVALKVADGDSEVSGVALLAALAAVIEQAGFTGRYDFGPVAPHGNRPVLNTRGARVGMLRAAGVLRFHV